MCGGAGASPSTAFFVAPLAMGQPDLWNTDLLAFRPRLVQLRAHGHRRSEQQHAEQLPHMSSAGDAAAARQRARSTSTTTNTSSSPSHSSVFDGMCLPDWQRGPKPIDNSPERALHRAVHAANLSWCELPRKKAFWRRIDGLGAWHSHFAQYPLRFVQCVLRRSGSLRIPELSYARLEAVLNATMPPGPAASLHAAARGMTRIPYEAECDRSVRLAALFQQGEGDGRGVADATTRQQAACRRRAD